MSKRRTPTNGHSINWSLIFPALLVGGAIGYVASEPQSFSGALSLFNNVRPSCNIKGNISISSGERIYHMPGQHWYDETVIRPEYGERWFCTEEEARAAGWRRAGY